MYLLKNKSPLAKRMIITAIILIVFFGLIFGFDGLRHYMMKKFFASYQPPPVTISSSKAKAEIWQPSIRAVGSLVAINGVNVTSQVAGQVIAIYFQSGQFVKMGQLIIKLDDRTDLEDLQNYQAQLKLDQLDFNRQNQLIKSKSVSQQAFDQAQAKLQQSTALVAKTQVLISQKTITAPFDGKIGIRMVNLGQYISPGTPLVNLQSFNPLYVQFSLPQQNLSQLFQGQMLRLKVDAYKGETFFGKVTAINSEVSNLTRNILVQGTIPNIDNRLYPGMFANVHVLLPKQENVVTVPQTAVTFNLFGDSVYVIRHEGSDKSGKPILRVHLQYVKTGERRNNAVAILSGIKTGDDVVTSGQLKLEDGTQVEINNSVNLNNAPSSEPE